MPMGDSDDDWGRPTRTFLYGPDKTKKTWWALRALEAGFNVILIDGDDGSSIKKQIPIEIRKRLLIVDAINTIDRPIFARFLASFFRADKPFIWDEQGKCTHISSTFNPTHSYIKFDVTKFTMNDVVILDSWTRLADALMMEWALENKIDLTSVEREGDQFSLMNYQSRFLNHILNKINAFPAHFIAIGHETVYEKFEADKTNPKKRIMVEQRTQPFSSTGPHAKKIGAHFSNYLRFTKLSDTAFRIDAAGDKNIAGGSRQLVPKVYKWEEISPNDIFKAVGSKATGEPCLGAVFIPKNSQQIPPQADAPANEVAPTAPQVLKVGSLSERLRLSKQQPQT